MDIVKLKTSWTLGRRIGKGGFGQVFEAVSASGATGVVKLIPKRPGAKRELLFEPLGNVPNVIPILETGETDDYWALAMPRADKSLRDHLDDQGGHLDNPSTTRVMKDVATALAALASQVVHRDLKPENVLLYKGSWCLADFGIARFAEASTETETLKRALTPAYAAPERWRDERATQAADVYSLGVIAFELIAGNRPFRGPSREDYRDQHLRSEIPPVPNCSPALGGLITECMFKAPEARPAAANILARIEMTSPSPSPAALSLQAANMVVVEKKAKLDLEASLETLEVNRRKDLLAASRAAITSLLRELAGQISAAAPMSGKAFPFELNGARIDVSKIAEAPAKALAYYNDHAPFEVVAYSSITLRIPMNHHGYLGRSHSLWYCDAKEAGRFRWFETAFMINPMMGRIEPVAPFALPPGSASGCALSPVMGEHQLAWPFTPIGLDNPGDFLQRWMAWFADAAQGRLVYPRYMPEREPRNSHR